MGLLPIHGFVLAGGKSSRMGRDKALLAFRGRPMIELAVEKLRTFCAQVSIAGNRDDLSEFASAVREVHLEAGPAAGIEAGLTACTQPWAMFLAVDVPLVPAQLLRRWAEAVLARERDGVRLSFLRAARQDHPAICLVHQDCLEAMEAALDEGIYKLDRIFGLVRTRLDSNAVWIADAEAFVRPPDTEEGVMEFWFSNINTARELAVAEAWAESRVGPDADPLRE